MEGHDDRAWHVAWSPKGTSLASCGGDKTVRIWSKGDSNEWTCEATLEEAQTRCVMNSCRVLCNDIFLFYYRTIRSCEWSPCGKYLAAVSFDATTVIWEKQGNEYEMIATLEGHENEVKSCAWNISNTRLATCSRDKSVWIWDADPDNDFECVSVLHDHSQDVKFVKWHPTKEFLLSASYDDTVKVWAENDDDWYCCDTLTGHKSTVWGLACHPKGDYIASCSDDCTVIIWKHFPEIAEAGTISTGLGKWRNVCCLQGQHERTIFSIDWGNNECLVTSDGDDTIRVFKASETDNPESEFHRSDCCTVYLSSPN
jgi:WD40 repeat protein